MNFIPALCISDNAFVKIRLQSIFPEFNRIIIAKNKVSKKHHASPAADKKFIQQKISVFIFTNGKKCDKINWSFGSVAQLVRVPASHAGGPRFEPARFHQNFPVALAEAGCSGVFAYKKGITHICVIPLLHIKRSAGVTAFQLFFRFAERSPIVFSTASAEKAEATPNTVILSVPRCDHRHFSCYTLLSVLLFIATPFWIGQRAGFIHHYFSAGVCLRLL